MTTLATEQLKTTREHVHIEGDKLLSAGFFPGEQYNVTIKPSHVLLIVSTAGAFKVGGSGQCPCIDLCSDAIGKALGIDTVVSVEYCPHAIEFSTIRKEW